MANTRVDYCYRDASNYQAYPQEDVIVSGELAWSDFDPALRPDDLFLPSDLGLPTLQCQLENYPNEDDHIWHQLLGLEVVDEQPTVEETAETIRDRLERIVESGWNEVSAIKKLEKARHGQTVD